MMDNNTPTRPLSSAQETEQRIKSMMLKCSKIGTYNEDAIPMYSAELEVLSEQIMNDFVYLNNARVDAEELASERLRQIDTLKAVNNRQADLSDSKTIAQLTEKNKGLQWDLDQIHQVLADSDIKTNELVKELDHWKTMADKWKDASFISSEQIDKTNAESAYLLIQLYEIEQIAVYGDPNIYPGKRLAQIREIFLGKDGNV